MSNYPFSNPWGSQAPTDFAYDIVLNYADPGIVFEPTESNGVYSEFREVAGCVWWALNAAYNPDNANWEQTAPCNAANPAYAIEQCADGTVNRYVAAATVVAGIAVSWVLVWKIDANGNMVQVTQTNTTSTQVGYHLTTTWNGGTSVTMLARQVSVTDTSSKSDSALDTMDVNGVTKWQVRKDGTLVAGIVPFSQVSGFAVPSGSTIDNATFTGTSTFNGPVHMHDGLEVDYLTVDSDATIGHDLTVDHNLHVLGDEAVDGNLSVGGTVTASAFKDPSGDLGSTVPAYASASFTSPAVGSTVNISLASTYIFQVGQTVIVSSASGPTVFGATVTAGNGFPATQITVTAEYYYQGVSGTTLANARITLGNGIANIAASDASITVSRSNNDILLTVPPPPIPALGTATGYAAASSTGSGSGGNGPGTISYTLPGTSSQNYQVTVQCTVGVGGADGMNLTVTGGTASGTPIGWSVGNFASYLTAFYVCTGTGGQTITATTSKGVSEFFQILAFRTS